MHVVAYHLVFEMQMKGFYEVYHVHLTYYFDSSVKYCDNLRVNGDCDDFVDSDYDLSNKYLSYLCRDCENNRNDLKNYD